MSVCRTGGTAAAGRTRLCPPLAARGARPSPGGQSGCRAPPSGRRGHPRLRLQPGPPRPARSAEQPPPQARRWRRWSLSEPPGDLAPTAMKRGRACPKRQGRGALLPPTEPRGGLGQVWLWGRNVPRKILAKPFFQCQPKTFKAMKFLTAFISRRKEVPRGYLGLCKPRSVF